jgi:hypothetical protein
VTPAEIWKKLTPSQRMTLLDDAGIRLGADYNNEALIRAGLKQRGHITPAFSSGSARHALGRKGLLKIGQTIAAPTTAAGFHTPRKVTTLGRAVVEHGLAILRGPLPPPAPSLAAAARAAGHEPETEEGGRAMMQAITPSHLQRAEAVRKMRTLKPGDEIKYTNFTIGGSHEGTAIVTWDHGKSVEARTLGGEKLRLERAADGSLRRFT